MSFTDQWGKKWWGLNDISVGKVIESGAYKGAKIKSFSKNGWVKIYWHGKVNHTFSVRVHWLTPS